MKNLCSMILTLAMTLSFSTSFAAIEASDYELRHLNKIEAAIAKECFLRGSFSQVSSKVTEIIVDQGIRDLSFLTVFTHRDWIDQGVFDDYKVTVESDYADMYDHDEANWGSYSVSRVSCEMI